MMSLPVLGHARSESLFGGSKVDWQGANEGFGTWKFEYCSLDTWSLAF